MGNARRKSNRRAIYLFGLDIYAWMVPSATRIKRYQASKDPNQESIDDLFLTKAAKEAAKEFIYEETVERRKIKEARQRTGGEEEDSDEEDYVDRAEVRKRSSKSSVSSSSSTASSASISVSRKRT